VATSISAEVFILPSAQLADVLELVSFKLMDRVNSNSKKLNEK
jgi:hypothetical protein